MAGKKSVGATLVLKDGNFSSGLKNVVNGNKKMKDSLKSATSQANLFQSGLSSLAKKVTAVAGAYVGFNAVKDLVGTAFTGAASMEGYRNTLDAVMKDTTKAAQTMAWAADFANKTPFETDDIVQATVRLTSYGLEAQKVMPAIGDMAGVMNKDIMQAVEAVADAQTGELERLKEFGITKQMIIDHSSKVMKGKEIVNKKGQITDQKAFNNTLMNLMDTRFKGGMEKQANSFNGLWSTVTGTFKQSIAQMAGVSATGEITIGGPFDRIKGAVKGVADQMTKWVDDGTIQSASDAVVKGMKFAEESVTYVAQKATEVYNVFKDNWPQIEPVVTSVTKAIIVYQVAMKSAAIWTGIVTGATKAWTIAVNLWKAAKEGTLGVEMMMAFWRGKDIIETGILTGMYAWETIVKKAHAAATWVQAAATGKLTITQWSLNGAFLACPITWIVLGIGLVVGIIILLWNKSEAFRNFFISMWESIKESTGKLVENFKANFERIKEMWENLKEFLKNPIKGVVKLFKKTDEDEDGGADVDGSHYFGLPRVPRDGYIARLHKDERVLTAQENKEYSGGKGGNVFKIDKIIISGSNMNADDVVNAFIPKLKLAMDNM